MELVRELTEDNSLLVAENEKMQGRCARVMAIMLLGEVPRSCLGLL